MLIASSAKGQFSIGMGYQDVKNRVPFIDNTMKELSWKPKVSMEVGLKKIFEFYRGEVSSAKALVDVK
jgi:dTDP-D-glucose 4,6-dehydratase